jgi:dipeptidyl aminopeptidase/acylaminoacyl peptidase
LVFSQTGEHGRFGLWSLDLTRNGAAPVPLVTGEAQQEFARVSPDGKWIAYISNESGEWEAYTAALAPSAEKVRLSAGGAINLAWSHDGRKVYFTSPDRRMFEVDIRTSPSLEAGEPRPIFTLPALGWTAFDVAPDGRFLAAVPQVSAIASPLSVVLNWESELAR